MMRYNLLCQTNFGAMFVSTDYVLDNYIDVKPPCVCFRMTLRGLQSLSLGQCILLQV